MNRAHTLYSELDRLVMDYLCIEGYRNAAEEFAKEASVAPTDLDSIEKRMNIRDSIQRGQIPEAIAELNDLDSEVSVPLRPLSFILSRSCLPYLIGSGHDDKHVHAPLLAVVAS